MKRDVKLLQTWAAKTTWRVVSRRWRLSVRIVFYNDPLEGVAPGNPTWRRRDKPLKEAWSTTCAVSRWRLPGGSIRGGGERNLGVTIGRRRVSW